MILDFVERLKILANIIRGELFIILDQFENYFQYHPKNQDKFDEEFIRLVNLDDLPIHLLVSIRSDQLYRFEQRFGERIIASHKESIALQSLQQTPATEAIKKPIERYNFIEHLENFSLTILCGKKDAGKSLFLQGYLYRYLKNNEDFQYNIFYFHNWQHPENNWTEIKRLINEHKNIVEGKTEPTNLLIIFDQCDDYFEKNAPKPYYNLLEELETIKKSENIKFVVAIRKIDSLQKALEELNSNSVHFCFGHFNLSDESLECKPFPQQEEKVFVPLAKFGKDEKEANDLKENIAEILDDPQIALPYLQLIMCERNSTYYLSL